MQHVGPPPGPPGLDRERWPPFCTLGRRRRDGSYTDPADAAATTSSRSWSNATPPPCRSTPGFATPTCCGTPTPPATSPAPATLGPPAAARPRRHPHHDALRPRCRRRAARARRVRLRPGADRARRRPRGGLSARGALLVSRCWRRRMLAMPPSRLTAGRCSSGGPAAGPFARRRGAPRPAAGQAPATARAIEGGHFSGSRRLCGRGVWPNKPSIVRSLSSPRVGPLAGARSRESAVCGVRWRVAGGRGRGRGVLRRGWRERRLPAA
jgi:hypothetical protein